MCPEEFSYRLKQRRKLLGLSVEDVALYLEVGIQTIYRIESGIQIPSIIQAEKLAFLFGCTIDELTYSEFSNNNNY